MSKTEALLVELNEQSAFPACWRRWSGWSRWRREDEGEAG